MKNSKREILSIEEVFLIFERFYQSKLSLAAFARKENIPYHRIIHYKRRLLQAHLLDPKSNSLIPKKKSSPKNPTQFLQILPKPLLPQNDSAFLLKAGIFQLSIPQHFQQDSFSKILEVLKQHV